MACNARSSLSGDRNHGYRWLLRVRNIQFAPLGTISSGACEEEGMNWVRNRIYPAMDRILDAAIARLYRRRSIAYDDVSEVLLGQLCARHMGAQPRPARIAETEFRVYSQWGEDGIIQYLTSVVPIAEKTFVEFGVQDYVESNTRFLLVKDNWSGLIIDSSKEHVRAVSQSRLVWRHDLTPLCCFIDRDNINELIATRFPGEALGLLSIDIDGNDYWVWRAITRVRPDIVVCEYNSVFGPDLAVTIPYSADFDRTRAHHSNLYFGASLAALCHLADEKGYAFVGSNSAGNNAFFVRSDRLSGLRRLTSAEGYVESKFRESRDATGRLNYLSGVERLRAIHDLPLVDVTDDSTRSIRQLYGTLLSQSADKTA
jgi:hypothetical protein